MKNIFPVQTDRLTIRQFRPGDAPAFHDWRNDPDVARYTLWPYPYSLAQAEAFCVKQAALMKLPVGDWVQLFIEERTSGTPVGDIGLGLCPEGDKALHVGYSIHRDQWGKGFATEAVGAVVPLVARTIGVKTAKAEIDVRNPASGKVLSKMGFRAGPVHPRRTFVKGEWCDEVDYVLELG